MIPPVSLRLALFSLLLGSGLGHAAPMRHEPVQGFRAGPRYPNGSLILSSDGMVYGTTSEGGADGDGTVFRALPDGSGFETVAAFSRSTTGAVPVCQLVEWFDAGLNRYLYGVTREGGAHGHGTVFRIAPDFSIETLVHFTGMTGPNRGAHPEGELILSADGNFHGTTSTGGAHDEGTIFRLTPAGVLTTLFDFDSGAASDAGKYPRAALKEGTAAGVFFGTTAGGGADGEGTVFKYSPTGGMTTLVEFTGNGSTNIGSAPVAPLIRASDGNYYGTTKYGGTYDAGTVFQMTPAGSLTTLAAFVYPIPNEHRGMWPSAALVEGTDGLLYGTTERGGFDDSGVVFQVPKTGGMTTLVDFNYDTDPKGTASFSRLLEISANTFLGSTAYGGDGKGGTLFRVTSAGMLTTLAQLSGRGVDNEGGPDLPVGGLVEGSDGQFYGTTYEGGVLDLGTVFRCAPDGTVTVLAEFTGNGVSNKGANPAAELVEGPDGNFYGTTLYGGASGIGTIFSITPAGTLTTLVEFTGNGGANPGSYPEAGLVYGNDGYFHGTTGYGGANGWGTVFRVTMAGVHSVLHDFDGADGSHPVGTLVKGGDGNYYGTTDSGGTDSSGTAFRVTPAGVLTTMHHFDSFAAYPTGLMLASDGNFYGTTVGTGFPYPFVPGYGFYGNVFRLTPAGDHFDKTLLVDFFGDEEYGTRGKHPRSRLVEGPDGNLYGGTSGGGTMDLGTLFRVSKDGFFTTLADLTGTGGDFPGASPASGPMIVGGDGNLYGTTNYGGVDKDGDPAGLGQIYRLRFWDYRNDKPVEIPTSESTLPPAGAIVWEDGAAGLYDGLLRDSTDGKTILGALSRLTVKKPKAGGGKGGAVSGTIRLNGRGAALKGAFDTNGVLATALTQRDGSVVTVNLQLMRTAANGAEVVRGTIDWDGVTTDADLARAPFNARSNPAPPAMTGRYTMVLPSEAGWGTDQPGGDGWALVTVNTGGGVSVSGRLGDGTRFTEAGALSAEMETSLYTELYRSTPTRGRFAGKLTFRDTPGISDFDGLMQWTKFADPRELRYPLGFSVEAWAIGGHYTAPAKGQRALSQLADQEYNACLSLIDETLLDDDGQIDRVVSWLANNRVRHYGPEKLNARVNAANGQITGSYLHPVSKLRIAFTGVAFQKQGLAAGNAPLATTSGAVRLMPGTGLEYPGSEDAGQGDWTLAPAGPAAAPATTDQPWSPAAAGVYQGVLIDAGDTNGAIESLSVKPNGAFSGTVWILGIRHAVKGVFAPDGGATARILRKNDTPVDVTLQLAMADGVPDGYQLTGIVSSDGIDYDLDAQRRPVYTKTNRAPQEGRYTLAIAEPDSFDPAAEPGGDGFGALTVGYTGVCSGTLTLADGARTSFSGHVSAAGEWSLHRGLYGRTPMGYLAGKLAFRDEAGVSDLDGLCHWVKGAGAPPAAVYPGGFDTVRGAVGSRYTAPAKGTRAWADLADDFHNAWTRLADRNGLDHDRVVTWTTANKIVYYGPENIRLTFNATNGTVGGKIVDTANGLNQGVGGVLFQKQSLVTGAFVSGGQSGRFWMEPR
ncbi:MAG: hypothetical protein KDM91_12275 [Verrucomicrobiae bacterium]|nr:hypothetical protein [Verrucomicrobiae bacterium]